MGAKELTLDTILPAVFVVRGVKAMLDSDLATLYGVETKVLNQAVKRNIQRFPDDFMFQRTEDEFRILRSQSVTSKWGGRRYIQDLLRSNLTPSVNKHPWISQNTLHPGYGVAFKPASLIGVGR